MRVLLIASVLAVSLAGSTAFSDINRIDNKDPERAAKGLALLYRDIGEGTISFFKDIFMTLDDVPKAILTDIFGGGQNKG